MVDDNKKNNYEKIKKYLNGKTIEKFVSDINYDITNKTSGIVEFFALSKINNIIINIYTHNYVLYKIIHPDRGIIDNENGKKINYDLDVINFRLIYNNIDIIDKIDVLYPK